MHTHHLLYRYDREAEWWDDLGEPRACACGDAFPHRALRREPRVALAALPRPIEPATLGPILRHATSVLLWGYCGALTAPLEPGHLVFATQILDPRYPGCRGWYPRVPALRRYQRPPDVFFAPLLTWPEAVLHRREKERLARRTGAWAVDMEAAHVMSAVPRDIPVLVVKMVLDGPRETLRDPAAFAMRRHRVLRQRVRPPLREVLDAWFGA